MILLNSTAVLQVLLAGAPAATQPVLYAAYLDCPAFLPGMSSGECNGTTAVSWVAAPSSSAIVRQVKCLSLYNADSATVVATVRVVDNGTNRILGVFTIAAGDRLEYDGQSFVVSAAGDLDAHIANSGDPHAAAGYVKDTATGTDAIALGTDEDASGEGAVALGDNASATADRATAITDSLASGLYAVAIGGANATADDTVAIGDGATASHANAVALGAGSTTDAVDSVSVGTRKIRHVVDGTAATDAVTKSQLDAAGAALVVDSIADSDTTHAPSRNAVFDALALKAPLASPTFTADHTVSQADFLTGVISPSALAAATNDWAPTSFSTCSIIRASCSAAIAITGLAGGAAGRKVSIVNVGSIDLLLTNEDAGSSAGNRFAFAQPLILQPNKCITLWYDGTSSRWRLLGPMPRALVHLASDVVNNNAVADTLQDVTGLSFPVISGKKYRFRFEFGYSSAASTTGSRWTVSGPTVTERAYWTELMNTSQTNRLLNGGSNAWDESVVTAATPNIGTLLQAAVWGRVQPSADGTVIGRFASEVSGSAITAKAGFCSVEYECVA
jgi:hypothetical protein